MYLQQIVPEDILEQSTHIALRHVLEQYNNMANEINKLNRLNDKEQPCKMFHDMHHKQNEWECGACHSKFLYTDNAPLIDTVNYCWHCGRKIIYWVKL